MKYRILFVLGALFLLSLLSGRSGNLVANITPDITVPPIFVYPPGNDGKLVNISTRGMAGSGEAVLIVGFVIEDADHYVLIRAVGPSLKKYGINAYLATPQIQVINNSSGVVVATAAAWSSQQGSTQNGVRMLAQAVGAFPLDQGSDDAVVHVKLAKGSYSLVVGSTTGASGIVLAEVYSSPTYTLPTF